MSAESASQPHSVERRPIQPEDCAHLSRTILHCASQGLSRTDFLNRISDALMDFSGCDAVEVRLSHGDVHYRWQARRAPDTDARFEFVRWMRGKNGETIPAFSDNSDLERICRAVACRELDGSRSGCTAGGSFWTLDAWEPMSASPLPGRQDAPDRLYIGGHYRSLAIIRFDVDARTIGLALLKYERPNRFSREEVEFFEGIAQTLGMAVADRRAEHALRERVKELTCLYGIARVAEQPEATLDKMLLDIVRLLPAAWQYPEIAAAMLILDDRSYQTPAFRPTSCMQSADIIVNGKRRGCIQVAYLKDRSELAVNPFLPEEEKLIAAVAREAARLVERKEADNERDLLQQQLIHADRLATIGQLAAGVAHELNEPLGGILGFAQLALKSPGLPDAAARDIEKIVTGALYAREVIKKLMVFARQVPARKEWVDLNQVVEEGLYFLEARCAKAGVRIVRELAADLSKVHADPAQLKQILVNLIVNAVQAMPEGGTLLIHTACDATVVKLVVEDTGVGIPADIIGKIFLPFFTTKDVNEGTGLGLAVVHGIVTSHGGAIEVRSEPGRGTRFEISLPADRSAAGQENDSHGTHP